MTQTPIQTSNGSRVLPTTAFETAARVALVRLRGALADMLSAAPEAGARRPVDIQRFLKTDRTTSWRLHKIASARDPLGVGTHVPGPASMQRVLKLASNRSVPPERIEAVRAAYRGVDELIVRFAGDRATFDSMVSGFADDEADTVDVAHRRAVFRGQSHIWGVQSRVHMTTWIAHPNADDPGLVDCACLHGYYDAQRLRPGALLPFCSLRVIDCPEVSDNAPGVEPIDGNTGGIGFLGEFCGSPAPPMRLREREDGTTVFEFIGNEIGAVGASTYLFGHVSRKSGIVYRTETERMHHFSTHTESPDATLVSNLLLHADTFGRPEVTSFWLSAVHELDRTPGPEERRPYELPIRDRVVYAGEGIAALHTTEMPRYSEMLAWAMERLGWGPDGFHAYHLRAEYPPMPSRAVFEVPKPKRRSET